MMLNLSGRMEVERAAEPYGTRFGGPPTDLHAIAGLVGIIDIAYCDMNTAAFVQNGPVTGTWGVMLRAGDSKVRQRFSLAHEIAHVALGIIGDEWRYKGEVAARGLRNPEERMCDYFAAALLMPRALVCQAVARQRNVSWLAGVFQVSEQSMRIRLEHIGLHAAARTVTT